MNTGTCAQRCQRNFTGAWSLPSKLGALAVCITGHLRGFRYNELQDGLAGSLRRLAHGQSHDVYAVLADSPQDINEATWQALGALGFLRAAVFTQDRAPPSPCAGIDSYYVNRPSLTARNWNMWRQWEECYDLIVVEEVRARAQYQWILRLRPDLLFLNSSGLRLPNLHSLGRRAAGIFVPARAYHFSAPCDRWILMARAKAASVMQLATTVCARIGPGERSLRDFLDALVPPSYDRMPSGRIIDMDIDLNGRAVPVQRVPAPELVLLWYGIRWRGLEGAFDELPVPLVKIRIGRGSKHRPQALCAEWWKDPDSPSTSATLCPLKGRNCSARRCAEMVRATMPQATVFLGCGTWGKVRSPQGSVRRAAPQSQQQWQRVVAREPALVLQHMESASKKG